MLVVNMSSKSFKDKVIAKVLTGIKASDAIAMVKAEIEVDVAMKAVKAQVNEAIFQVKIADGTLIDCPLVYVNAIKKIADKNSFIYADWNKTYKGIPKENRPKCDYVPYPSYVISKCVKGWKMHNWKLCKCTQATLDDIKASFPEIK
jgi:hypothetical protein